METNVIGLDVKRKSRFSGNYYFIFFSLQLKSVFFKAIAFSYLAVTVTSALECSEHSNLFFLKG